MEVYQRPEGPAFQHDEPTNVDGQYYYTSYVQLPRHYFADKTSQIHVYIPDDATEDEVAELSAWHWNRMFERRFHLETSD